MPNPGSVEARLSILNIVDNKQKPIRKKDSRRHGFVVQALCRNVSHERTSLGLKGNNDLALNLSSIATQLGSFVNGLTLKKVAAVYQQRRKLQRGIGRVEGALEKSIDNSVATV